MTQLTDLMNHIDYFYEEIPSVYGNKRYIVHLEKDTWMISQDKEILIGTTDQEVALKYLTENSVDLGIFHSLLFGKIATEGVLRREQLKKIENLIGTEAINEQEEVWNEFAESLFETIQKEVNKPKLEVVDGKCDT